MVKFLLLRHGESQNNGSKRYSGQYDTALSEKGRWQAERVGEYLSRTEEIGAIYASDLSRAADTARPTARRTGLEVILRKDLREIDVGIFQNRPYAEIAQLYPKEVEAYRFHNGKIPGGESYGDVGERGRKVLEELALKHEGQTVLVATHGALIRSLICFWSGLDYSFVNRIEDIKNATLTEVIFEKGAFCSFRRLPAEYLQEETVSAE